MENQIRYISITKLLSATALFIITIGLWATWANPATKYEPSIYLEVPIIFWIGYAITAIILPISFYILYRKGNLPKKFFLHITTFLIIIGSVSLVFLYIIHGYDAVAYYGDTGTHLDNIYQLVSNNICTSIYPGLYYLTGISIVLCGVDYMLPILYLPAALTMIFLMGMFLVSRRLTTVSNAHYITFFIAAFFPFGCSYYINGLVSFYKYLPYLASLFLFPIGVYFIFKILRTPNKIYILGAFIISSALVFYHPLGYLLYLLFVFIAFVVCGIWIFSHKTEAAAGQRMLAMLCFTLVSYLLWLFQTSAYKEPVGAIRKIIFGVNVEGRFSGELNSIADAVFGSGDFSIMEIIELMFRQYTILIPLAIFIITVSLIVLKQIKKRNTENSQHNILEITTLVLFVFPTVLIALSAFFVINSFQPGRVILYLSFTCIVLSGIALYELGIKHHSQSNLMRISAGILIIISVGIVCMISPISYYCSVHTICENYQDTDTELAYEVHYLSYKTPLMKGIGFSHPYRFQAYNEIYGNGIRSTESTYDLYLENTIRKEGIIELHDHFGYENRSMLGNYYTEKLYLHITGRIQAIYESPYHPIWSKENHIPRYTRIDFTQLLWDKSVDITYDVGPEKLYIIHPKTYGVS